MSGKRTDRRPRPQLLHRGDRRRVDEDLGEVAREKRGEDPAVGSADAAADGLHDRDVEPQIPVVLGEQFGPPVVRSHPLTRENGTEEVDLHDPHADAEQIVVQIPTRLEEEEDGDDPADQQDRNGRRVGAAESHRQGDAGDDDRPVAGRVEAVPPDFALIHLSAIQMRESADFGGAEACRLFAVHTRFSRSRPARSGIVPPKDRSGKRCFTRCEAKRLAVRVGRKRTAHGIDPTDLAAGDSGCRCSAAEAR